MPKIKDVKIHLPAIIDVIKEANDLSSIYIWGSFAENYDKPNFRVRDIDIIAKTSFHSGDLMAIEKEILAQDISSEELENQGYCPQAIKFSQDFTSIVKYNLDHWAISSDKKLLHWGPIPQSPEESEMINKEAENHAAVVTGHSRKTINTASEEIIDSWYKGYHEYLKKEFNSMPSGWYLSDIEDVESIIDKAIQL